MRSYRVSKLQSISMYPLILLALQERRLLTINIIDDWLEGVRPKVNAMQFEFVQLVADRLIAELGMKAVDSAPRQVNAASSEPLRYLLHGPPGTGKSHALRFVQELLELVGLKRGLDWQFLAFQATNAADLGGDTIHHACSFNISVRSFEQTMKPDAAKRMAYWRRLFVDEISREPQIQRPRRSKRRTSEKRGVSIANPARASANVTKP